MRHISLIGPIRCRLLSQARHLEGQHPLNPEFENGDGGPTPSRLGKGGRAQAQGVAKRQTLNAKPD
jgi:hypothetical protein